MIKHQSSPYFKLEKSERIPAITSFAGLALLRFVQDHLLPEKFRKLEIKTLRFRFLRCVAIVIEKSRQIILRFCSGYSEFLTYEKARQKLRELAV